MADNQALHIAYTEIQIGGSILPAEVMDHVTEVTVENTLHLPDVAVIRIEDEKFEIHLKDMFQIGKEVKIKFGYDRNSLTEVFAGEIVARDHDMAAHMVASFTIRCYDKSHRLHRGRERGSFQNTKDSDIVKKLAQRAGLQSNVDTTGEVHPYVYQNNQTNWEFINFLAQRNNCRTFVASDNTLHFKKIEERPATNHSLEWGKDLTSFRPRISSSGQVPKVIVKSWDPKKKAAITGQATSPQALPELGMNSRGGQIAASAFGDSAMVVVDRVPRTQGGADKYAQSILDEIAAGFVEADGLTEFHENVKPGAQIEIKNIGQHLSGKYCVTSATHHYSPTEGLSTQFAVSGKKPTTLSSAMGGGIHDRTQLGGSVVVGIVTNNQDPEGNCRVKVKFPHLSDDDESYWAPMVSPMAGKDRGFVFLPEVGDEVLVAFEQGDIHHPYVLGGVWNGVDSRGEEGGKASSGEGVVRRTIKSRIGHTMLMDDTGGMGEISFKTAAGHFVCMDDKNKKISIIDMTGANSIVIDSMQGNIDINCTGNFSVTAGRDMSATSGMNMSFTAGAQYSLIAGATAGFTAAGALTITGLSVSIN